MTELSHLTPVEIDTELNKLYFEKDRAVNNVEIYAWLALKTKDEARAALHRERSEKWDAEANRLVALIRPLQQEFVDRGGWTRYWLVTNSNGHVHHTQHCTTTYAGTSFAWLTQYSGMPKADLVELAGEKACTVCFPDAPVDVLKRTSRVKTPEQDAREAKKAEKKAAAEASQVVVNHYRDGSRTSTKTFKTVRAVTNEIASTLSSMVHYGPTHPSFEEWRSNVDEMIEALVTKGEVEDGKAYLTDALARARKKCIADHKKFMASAQAASWRAQGLLNPEVDEPGYTPVKY